MAWGNGVDLSSNEGFLIKVILFIYPIIVTMTVIHIEHQVPNFEGWKKAFHADPIDRKSSGVKTYRLYRSISNPNYVAIDLEFDNKQNAEETLKKLQLLWGQVDGVVINGPKAQIFEVIEESEI